MQLLFLPSALIQSLILQPFLEITYVQLQGLYTQQHSLDSRCSSFC